MKHGHTSTAHTWHQHSCLATYPVGKHVGERDLWYCEPGNSSGSKRAIFRDDLDRLLGLLLLLGWQAAVCAACDGC